MIEWSDEQRQMQAAVREFVQKEVVPRRVELEHGELAPYDLLRSYVRTFGIDEMAPERFARETSGPPCTTEERYERAVMTLLPMVEFCRHCPGMITGMGVSMNLAGNAIKKGTSEQGDRRALPLLTLETSSVHVVPDGSTPHSARVNAPACSGAAFPALRSDRGVVPAALLGYPTTARSVRLSRTVRADPRTSRPER